MFATRRIGLVFAVAFTAWTSTSEADDWPMWRFDATRSAASPNALPEKWEPLWTREFAPRVQAWDDPLNLDLMTYDRVFEPIVLAGRLLVGFNDQDKLLALDAASGRTLWTFYAEAPIRLAPVGADGRVYVCSDDGFLYCLNARDGQVEWKFRGAPNGQRAIGNRRLVSAWPARGGPVLRDGTVYFSASIWPFMGTFIYALDAQTGAVQWVNNSTGAQYIKQPHSAPSFAGVAPQGALVATEELLVVPGGRSVPAVFDRADGSLKYFELNAGGKGTGGSFVTADRTHFYVHTRERGTRAFDLATGTKTAFMPNEPVIAGDVLYSAELVDGKATIAAYPANMNHDKTRQPLWRIEADGQGDLILSGDHLVAAGTESLTIIRLPGSDKVSTATGQVVQTMAMEESVARILVADKKLFAVTESGKIMAFGDSAAVSTAATESAATAATASAFVDPAAEAYVADLLSPADASGYALWFGPCEQAIVDALATASPFEQLGLVDRDAGRVESLRRHLDGLGQYGRLTVHASTPIEFRAPRYVANLLVIAKEIALDVSPELLESLYASVRPYGGVMHLLVPENEASRLAARVAAMNLEHAEVTLGPRGVIVRRVGALPGAADWTHQHGDIANTVKSNDSRVKLPLGVLWFGGSSNMDVLPRHGHGPPQQVVGGRLFIEGMNSLSARDVYTGRVLWKREFEDLGTYDVYYDATYEDTPLDPKYNQVHIPGANARGTNYVVTDDRIYLVVGNRCRMLDPATGADVGEITLPQSESGETPEWGYIGIYQDVLIGGLGFAMYRDRHQLQFPGDQELKSNKAGFGSKSFDRAASRALVAFDRHTGQPLWQIDANHSFWHNGIVAGGDKIYCLDKNPTPVEEAMQRRGLEMPGTYRIVAVDYRSGQTEWEINEGIFGTWLGYSEQHDLLLQAGAQGSDRLVVEVGQGMAVYQAADGSLKWKHESLKYAGPCILHNEWIITNVNSYSQSAGAFDLLTGEQRMVEHPLTGERQPWTMTRAYGCNSIIASEHLLTFRSGAAGVYDWLTQSGTGNLGGFKSGCTSNLVAANGVLNAPDYTRTCSCAYQNQTSLGLVHMPDVEVWSVNAMVTETKGQSDQPIERLGINFGAPGDRRDDDGVLWMEYPRQTGESLPVAIAINDETEFFQQHSSVIQDHVTLPWVVASGAEKVTQLNIALRMGRPLAPEVSEADTQPQATSLYDLLLCFGTPAHQQDQQTRVFDIYVQDNLVATDYQLPSAGDQPIDLSRGVSDVLSLTGIEAGDVLKIRFVAKQGDPVISGIRLRRVAPDARR